MNNRVGFARFDQVTSDQIQKIAEEVLRFRYFVIEKVVIEIWSEEINSLFQFAASIYLSTYSALEIPIFIVIPQVFSTSYTPNSSDLCFAQSFFNSQVLRLPLVCSVIAGSTNLNPGQKRDKGCMGGTFDHFHSGHLVFLTAAAYYTNSIGIGISSFSILGHKHNSEFIQPWRIRARNVKDFLMLIKKDLEVDVFELFDPVCRARDGDYEVVILTTEVVKAIDLINDKRSENNLKPLDPVVIDLLEIGQLKLSSTQIRASFLEKNKGTFVTVKEKWNVLCERLGVTQEINEKWWDFISIQYSRSSRYYHTLAHIENCYKLLATPSLSMELAIFFHDLVYIPMKHPDLSTNEEMSACYFQEFLIETGLQGFESVKDYILATISHTPRLNTLEELEFLDIDLSILASPWEEYLQYASDIRSEYNWYTDLEYKNGRTAVLKTFLNKGQIFYTKRFADAEILARKNIEKEIQELLAF